MTDKIEVHAKVVDVSNAVTAITDTEAGIAELAKKYKGVIYDCTDSDGMAAAKVARREIREPRYNIENLRKAAKAPVLELGRSLDQVAKDLTARILELEEPVDEQIKAEEKRIADAKQKLIDDEKKRVDGIQARITEMYDGVTKITSDPKAPSGFVQRCIEKFLTIEIDDSFEEFKDDALKTWDAGEAALQAHLVLMTQREADEKKAAEDAAELERLRKEKADRDAADALVRAEEREVERQAAEKAAAIPPVEKQLDDLSFGTSESDPVETTPAPEVVEDTVVAATEPDYPGDHNIIYVLAQHFDISEEVAVSWLKQFKGEQA